MTNDATKKTGQGLYTSSFIAQFIDKIFLLFVAKADEQLIQKFRREVANERRQQRFEEKKARKLALITAKDKHEKKSDDNKQDESKKKTTEEKKQIDEEEEKKKQRKPMIEWSKLPSFTWGSVFTKYLGSGVVLLETIRRENARKQNEKSAVHPCYSGRTLNENVGRQNKAFDARICWSNGFREDTLGRGQSKQNQHTLLKFNLDKGPSNEIPEDKTALDGNSNRIQHNTTYRESLRYRWYEVPIVKQGIQYILQALKNVNVVDNEGLRIIENDHCAMLLLEKLVRKYHSKYSNCTRQRYPRALLWKEIDTLKEYHD
ncbi:hypothetical protein RFI_39806, partial [Reticulomyxa filosa]